jgi:hypothetical protein
VARVGTHEHVYDHERDAFGLPDSGSRTSPRHVR